MTTNTYKHFGVKGKQTSSNIHTNTERRVSPFISKKTTALFYFIVTTIVIFLHGRNNNVLRQSNYICRMSSRDTKYRMDEVTKTVTAIYPNILPIIDKLIIGLSMEEYLEKMENIINKSNETKDLEYSDVLHSVFECLSLSSKEDQEEFIIKITSGPLKSDVLGENELDTIVQNASSHFVVNTNTLITILGLLSGNKNIDVKEIRNLLIKNFLIGLGYPVFSRVVLKSNKEIKKMLYGRDIDKSKNLLKQFYNEERESINSASYVASFIDSLTMERERKEYQVRKFEQYCFHLKYYYKLFYDCLEILIETNGDDILNRANNIIILFNSYYNNRGFRNKDEVDTYNDFRFIIIKRFQGLIDNFIINRTFESFVNNIESVYTLAKLKAKL